MVKFRDLTKVLSIEKVKEKKKKNSIIFSSWKDQEDTNMEDPRSTRVEIEAVLFRVYIHISHFL